MGDPTPSSKPQGGAREGHLSPWVTLWGGVGGCPWRSVEGGRGGCLPRGHRLLPRQLLAQEVLGSVWKAVLSVWNWRGGWWTGCASEPGPALPLRTSWVQLAPRLSGRPRAGVSGVSASIAPTQFWKDGGGMGVQRENLAPSGILEKLNSKDTQPWLCCPQKAARRPRVVVRAEMKLPEAILEGDSSRRQLPRLDAGDRASWGKGL